jgi:hypothetical protein
VFNACIFSREAFNQKTSSNIKSVIKNTIRLEALPMF